jgi:serine/threonine protein kinase
MRDGEISPHEASPAPRVVGGTYEIQERIGTGGMGSVWRAVHRVLGTEHAIKFLHGKIAGDTASRTRFEREARLAARLGEKCVNVGRVVDVGVDESDVPYIVMELLRGEDLEARLARDARLPPDFVRDVVHQLCRALTAAHETGVVHRDLKPANVFLCSAGTRGSSKLLVKLLDFGVAKGAEGRGLTATGGVAIGTPQFMSPEQLQASADVDARSDLWALGAIVYRMLVGREAFTGITLEELAMRVMFSPHVNPSAVDPVFGPELDAFMNRALAKKPAHRFQTARELAAALDHALDAPRSESTSDVTASHDADTFRLPVARAPGLAGVAAAVAVVAVLGGLLALRVARAPSPPVDAVASQPLVVRSPRGEVAPSPSPLPSLQGASGPGSAVSGSSASSALPARVPAAASPPAASGAPSSARAPASAQPIRSTAPRGPNLEGKSAAAWKDGNQM